MKYGELIKRRGLIKISPAVLEEINFDELSSDLFRIGCIILRIEHDFYRNTFNMWLCYNSFDEVLNGCEASEYSILVETFQNSIPSRVVRRIT